MATPVISTLPAQNLVAGQPFTVHVPISNRPTTVRVRGLIYGASYTWDTANDRCTIRGTAPPLLLANAIWMLEASNDDGDATPVDITYSFVHGPPVIDSTVSAPDVIIGSGYEFFIPVTNIASEADVVSELMGLSHELGDNADGDRGVRVFGKAVDDNYTVNAGRFDVSVENTGGMDRQPFDFDIKRPIFYIGNGGRYNWKRIQFNGDGNDISSDLEFKLQNIFPNNVDVDADYIYGYNTNTDGVYRAALNFQNQQTTPSTLLTTLSVTLLRGIAVDDDYIYVGDITPFGERYYVRNKNTGSAVRSFTTSFGRSLRGMVSAGDHLIGVYSGFSNILRWIQKTAGAVAKTVTMPLRNDNNQVILYSDITLAGTTIYLTNETDELIVTLDESIADGTVLTEFDATYNVPSSLRPTRGIAAYIP